MGILDRLSAGIVAALSPRPSPPPPFFHEGQEGVGEARGDALTARGDAWYSTITGLGTLTHDKRRGATFRVVKPLARYPDLVRELMRGEPIFRKAVSKQVWMAFLGGLTWTVEGEPGDDTTASQAVLASEVRRLHVVDRVKQARIWGRALGGAILVANCDDGLDPSEPLDLERLDRVVHLRKIDCTDVHIEHDQSGGERDGEPEFYTLPARGLMRTRTRVHHTRVFHFPGQATDDTTRAELGGWDDSAGQPVYDAIQGFMSGAASLSTQLQDAVQPVYKIRGLADALRAGNLSYVRNWIKSMELFRSALRAIGLDAEDEDFDYKSRPLGDSVKLFHALMHVVAAAADMPVTELFQMAPAGLSTDDSAGRTRWYDKIDSEERQGVCGEALDWIAMLLSYQRSTPELLGARIAYAWAPLEKEDATEAATTRKIQAEIDEITIRAGMYTPRQLAELRAPGDGVDLTLGPAPTTGEGV